MDHMSNKNGGVETADANSMTAVAVAIGALMGEGAKAKGVYVATCLEVVPEHKREYDAVFQRYMTALTLSKRARVHKRADFAREAKEIEKELHAFTMQEVWSEEVAPNVVCTIGKNLVWDQALAGSSYTVVGPYMGLISSVSWSAVAAADTMASHAGWLEAGSTNAPTFAARGSIAWSAASAGAKATSSATSFTMTGAGTLKGCFIVLGTGAVTTLGSTAGTLLSAGTFTGGDQVVASGNVVTVTYSISM